MALPARTSKDATVTTLIRRPAKAQTGLYCAGSGLDWIPNVAWPGCPSEVTIHGTYDLAYLD
jgi:hypothetical protein